MKRFLSERNIVVLLFVVVLVTFYLAKEDSKKMEQMFTGVATNTADHIAFDQQQAFPAENKTHQPTRATE